MRVPLRAHLLLLLRGERRTGVVVGRGVDFAVAGWQDAAGRVGWGAEFVRLREDALFAVIVGGGGGGGGCGASLLWLGC